jgi:hypothetical protein
MQTLDFNKCYWGHNHTLKSVDPQNKPGVLSGFIWHTPKPKLGDLVIWPTAYGYAKAIITECEWTINVDDMYKVTVKVAERIDPQGNVLPEHPDG